MIPFLVSSKRQADMVREVERAIQYAQEQSRVPKSKVEIVARRYCEELGYDPDAPLAMIEGGGPRWTKYRDVVEAALHQKAMQAALASVADFGAECPDSGTDTTDNDLHGT